MDIHPGHRCTKYFPTDHTEENIFTFILVIIVEAEAQRAWRKLCKLTKCISCEALIWSQVFLTWAHTLIIHLQETNSGDLQPHTTISNRPLNSTTIWKSTWIKSSNPGMYKFENIIESIFSHLQNWNRLRRRLVEWEFNSLLFLWGYFLPKIFVTVKTEQPRKMLTLNKGSQFELFKYSRVAFFYQSVEAIFNP